MKSISERADERASQLRCEFDQSFAEPAQPPRTDREDYIHIVVAGVDYALRLSQIAGLQANRRIVDLPKRASAFLGVSSFRGEIVPVYSLAQLLGYAPHDPGRWMAVVRHDGVFAIEFEELVGHLRLGRGDVVPANREDGPNECVRYAAHVGTTTLPLISIGALFERIKLLSEA